MVDKMAKVTMKNTMRFIILLPQIYDSGGSHSVFIPTTYVVQHLLYCQSLSGMCLQLYGICFNYDEHLSYEMLLRVLEVLLLLHWLCRQSLKVLRIIFLSSLELCFSMLVEILLEYVVFYFSHNSVVLFLYTQ